jgi:broad specificity phosphatase PhoE
VNATIQIVIDCADPHTLADVRRRLVRAIREINSERPVLVTHGTAIHIAATALLDVPTMTAHRFAQDNAALNVFVWRAGKWVMKIWNDATHCKSEE